MTVNWERHLLQVEGKRGEVRSLLAPSEFVTDRIFLTKQGHLGCLVRIAPIPFESLDDSDVEHRTAQFVASLRNLDSTMRVYQYVMKHGDPPIADRLPSARTAFLRENTARMFSMDTCWAIVHEVEQPGSSNQAEIDARIQLAAQYLTTVVSGFLASLTAVLKAELLHEDAAFAVLSWLVNYDPRLRNLGLKASHEVDWQMAHSAIDCAGPLKVGSYYVRVMTLKDLPSSSSAFCLRDLCKISCGMVIVTEWNPIKVSDVHRTLKTQRRHYGHTKASVSSGGTMVDGGLEERDLSLMDIQRKIEKDGTYLGEWSLTVILYSEDPAVLRKAVSEAHGVLQQRRGALVEQQGRSALVAWLAAIPGNANYSIRQSKIDNLNYGDLSFLFGADTGQKVNAHLGSESLVVLENLYGQPYHFNMHRGQVGHTVHFGKSGSGKTYFVNLIIHNIQKYPGVKTFIFDIMNGYQKITEELGGTYVQLGAGPRAATINPFSLPPTEDNLAFLLSFVRLLIESDGAEKLGNRELVDLARQIRLLYQMAPHLRRLASLLLIPAVGERLDRWVKRYHFGFEKSTGPYAYLFDNEIDSLEMGDFQAFNFPALQKDHPEALEALVFYIVNWVNRAVATGDRTPKFVFMDEALEFLRKEETRRFVSDGLMRWRHHNAALFIATQSLSHLEGTVAASVIEQCVTRVYSANPGIDVEEWSRRLQLTATEAQAIRRLRPAKELLIQGSGVVRVDADPVSHELYSGRVSKLPALGELQGREVEVLQ
jgi:type IV secretion system protein TrbE